ncbi:RNA-binding protein [bacterium]|nr:RNA-binding protein [bacterium]
MPTKIFVGNMPYAMTKEDLKKLFSEIGPVVSASVIIDRETKRSRGFGFVEMETEEATQKALETLNEFECAGRKLIVKEAHEKKPLPPKESAE